MSLHPLFLAKCSQNRQTKIELDPPPSTSGGMGKESDKLMRQIAMKFGEKRGERYCDVVGFVRGRIRYDLIK